MPKRISDVSLHVYVTPETLHILDDAVRATLDDFLGMNGPEPQEAPRGEHAGSPPTGQCGSAPTGHCTGDICVWRVTFGVSGDDPRHREFEARWRADAPGRSPAGRRTHEIAIGLVGDVHELTDEFLAGIRQALVERLDALLIGELYDRSVARSGAPVTGLFTMNATQRTDVDAELVLPERI